MKHIQYPILFFAACFLSQSLPMDTVDPHIRLLKREKDSVQKHEDVSGLAHRFDKKGNTPLHLAAKTADVEKVNELIPNSNINALNSSLRTPLGECIYEWNRHPEDTDRYWETANVLFQKKSDPRLGCSMLHDAVAEANPNSLKLLLEYSASSDAVDDTSTLTPLLLALKKIHELNSQKGEIIDNLATICSILIDFNASPNTLDKESKTPIMWAGIIGSPELLARLISHQNSLVNAQDQFGETALMHTLKTACTVGYDQKPCYEHCIKLLIFRGANPYIPNYNANRIDCFTVVKRDPYLEDTLNNLYRNKHQLQSSEQTNILLDQLNTSMRALSNIDYSVSEVRRVQEHQTKTLEQVAKKKQNQPTNTQIQKKKK